MLFAPVPGFCGAEARWIPQLKPPSYVPGLVSRLRWAVGGLAMNEAQRDFEIVGPFLLDIFT